MGGYGSGRQGGKETTEYCRALDVRQLQRNGRLRPGQAFSWTWTISGKETASINIRTEADRVTLDYRSRGSGGEWVPKNYPVSLEWTPCNLGGRRAWFICPAKGCGRRVAVLFGGSIFACRHCHKLAYASQRERGDGRAMRRADTIRRRMGWGAGIANPPGDKPKGMHWRTYNRLMRQYRSFAIASWEGISKRFGLMDQRISRMKMNRSGGGLPG